MNNKTNPSAGRQVLRAALRDLEDAALAGKSRTEAIHEANRRLAQAGLATLGPTTVGNWFEKGSPAKDFQSLWTLVQVLLEWSPQPSPRTAEGPARSQATRALWKKYWELAKTAAPRTASSATASSATAPLVTAYLAAARDVARQHPYPGLLSTSGLPTLADVYVRQQACSPAADHRDRRRPGNTTARVNQADPAVPATEVFREDQAVCVLLGGPGGGKSTLLRAQLADCADSWLAGRTATTIPVMVSAAALTGTDPLPAALARTVTGDLRRVGLLEVLPADFFRLPPRSGVSWLVLVDGLDEIPDADTRSAVVTMLVGAAANGKGLYRFVVATRPLPASELTALGRHVPRYELQPFSREDLHTYATRWFQGLEDPGHHVTAFMTGLGRSRLEVLARTPLMAFMLCQLYTADPARPMPDGRTGAYQSFAELIYEQNTHKNIKNTHDEAIRRLKDRHQISKDNQAAEQAALQVRDHLPELIDHLAYERINAGTAHAIEILASHLHASRPPKVNAHLWESFLSDLLRPTGIVAQHADDFDFLHQTLLEFHAARHATRDEQSRAQLLQELIASAGIPTGRRRKAPDLDDSYLGFLLDGLLAPQDRIATETIRYVEELTAAGGERACRFLTTQVNLRTSLPAHLAAAHLARDAADTTLNDYFRVRAAEALAQVDRKAGAAHLARLPGDTTLYHDARVQAAEALAQVDREAGAAHLARLADDTTLYHGYRVQAAEALARVDREAGAAQLARVNREASAAQLNRLAGGTTVYHDFRVQAAEALARVDSEAGAAQLIRLADDTALYHGYRLRAAEALARVDKEAGAAHLARLASDITLDSGDRAWAAETLIRVDKEASLVLLGRLADDTTLDTGDRAWAAKTLNQVDKSGRSPWRSDRPSGHPGGTARRSRP
ncbi:hypothetical protein ABUW04_32975 [Streptacidiphilus sp. N1-10]|uniref:NACHT domain-containing protein n=1 Tax=Streptacidiphilus jeojiensis TaxID=3229225 RepID=A0ABV6XXR2_9ACTN